MLLRWILARILRNYSGEELEDLAYDYITHSERSEELWFAVARLQLRDPKRYKQLRVMYDQFKKNYETEQKND